MKIVGDVLIIETSDPDELPPLLGGDLNPLLGFCFPLFPMVLPWEIAIRVENGGFSRKQNRCKLLQVYVHFICWLYLIKP